DEQDARQAVYSTYDIPDEVFDAISAAWRPARHGSGSGAHRHRIRSRRSRAGRGHGGRVGRHPHHERPAARGAAQRHLRGGAPAHRGAAADLSRGGGPLRRVQVSAHGHPDGSCAWRRVPGGSPVGRGRDCAGALRGQARHDGQWFRWPDPGPARRPVAARPARSPAALARRGRPRPRRHWPRESDRHHPARSSRPVIALIRGRVRRKYEDRMVIEAGGVGYEVVLPPVVQHSLSGAIASDGDGATEVTLEIHYHATQNQPSPVLIGFHSGLDKEFFEKLITVKDVGPLVAARSLAAPVAEIAAAMARQDEPYLRRLPGIGPQKAKNIVAQLSSEVAKFALSRPDLPAEVGTPAPRGMDEDGLRHAVFEILTKQLGHRPSEAAQLISAALGRKPGIATPEDLFDEIYRGAKTP